MKKNIAIRMVMAALLLVPAFAAYATGVPGYRDLDGNISNGIEAYFDGQYTYNVIFQDASRYIGTFPSPFLPEEPVDFYKLDYSNPRVSHLNLSGMNYGGTKTWNDAMDWAANLNINGITGWNLGSSRFSERHYVDGFRWWEGFSDDDRGYLGGVSDSFNGGAPFFPKSDLYNAYAWHLGDVGTPATIPLPAVLPLMLSGLGILGFAARRRKTVPQ